MFGDSEFEWIKESKSRVGINWNFVLHERIGVKWTSECHKCVNNTCYTLHCYCYLVFSIGIAKICSNYKILWTCEHWNFNVSRWWKMPWLFHFTWVFKGFKIHKGSLNTQNSLSHKQHLRMFHWEKLLYFFYMSYQHFTVRIQKHWK